MARLAFWFLSPFFLFGGDHIPVTNILKLESDKNAECCVAKFKDSLWLDKSKSSERIRVYFDVLEGEVSGLRLIMQGKSVRFLRDISHVAKLPQEKDFMRCDVVEEHVPVKVKGTSEEYNKSDTEVVLRFLEPLAKGKYVLIFDLHSDGYEKTSFLTFFLRGLRWVYESRNFYSSIKREDKEFAVECKKIELWIVPPYGGIFWHIEPDRNVLRYTWMTEEAIAILQKDYGKSEVGPAGRLALQWEKEGEFGKGTPSMMSRVECKFAQSSPLVLTLSLGGFTGFVITILNLLNFFG